MPTAAFTIKRGDTLPGILGTTIDKQDRPVDLTGATVYFVMRKVGQCRSEHAIRREAQIKGPATEGKTLYEWADGDTDTTGRYAGEFEFHQNGKIWTSPSIGCIPIVILPDNG